jgi:transposase-like protein
MKTYVRVGGQWKYLFRAVDKHGELIDFMLLDRRDTGAAYRFLGKALKTMRRWPPRTRSLPTSFAPIPKPSIGCSVNVN